MRRVYRYKKTDVIRQHLKIYHKLGFCVIPAKQRSKKPDLDRWKQYEDPKNRPDWKQIEKWFFSEDGHWNGRNVIIVCGRASGNLIACDFDRDSKGKLMEKIFPNIRNRTLVIKTKRGFHVYFRSNWSFSGKKLKELGIDVQAEGRYVIGAPSEHPDSTPENPIHYKVVSELITSKIEEIPGDFMEYLFDRISEAGIKFNPREYRDEINLNNFMAGVEQGGRNEALIRLATYWRRSGANQEESIEKATQWNEKNKPPLDLAELERTIQSAYTPENPYAYRFSGVAVVEREFYPKEIEEEAEKLLHRPDLIEWIEKNAFNDIIGHRAQKMMLFLLNLVNESVHVHGDTSTGKSYMADRVFDCFPRHTWFKITGVTDKAIRYLDENISHLYLAEWGATTTKPGEESTAQFDVKLMISEGKLRILVVERDEETHRLRTRTIETTIENVISTTTDTRIPPELLNRVWEITTNKGLTKRIVEWKVEQRQRLPSKRTSCKRERQILRCIVEKLEDAPRKFVIPYMTELKRLFEPLWHQPRTNRDEEKLERAIYAVALLHSKNRPIVVDNEDPVLICFPQDFFYAWEYGKDAIIGTFTGVTQRYAEIRDKIKEICEARKELSSATLANYVGIKQAAAWNWLKTFEENGLITRVGRKGKGGRLFFVLSSQVKEVSIPTIIKMSELFEATNHWFQENKLSNFQIHKTDLEKFSGKNVKAVFPVQKFESLEELPDIPLEVEAGMKEPEVVEDLWKTQK